jgi:hypothetical protein
MPTVRPAMTSPVSQPTSTGGVHLMSAEPMHEGSALTVTGNPAKDREESEEIMDGLLGLNIEWE